ncbi:MAG TPA: hypothetical protein VF077_00340 [Nitrospiraceae bacterium]
MSKPKEPTYDDLQQTRRDLVELTNQPGWKLVKDIIDQQCRLRRIQVFGIQPSGLDDAFQLTRLQGEVAGLQFIQSLVATLLDEVQSNLDAKLAEEEEEGTNG